MSIKKTIELFKECCEVRAEKSERKGQGGLAEQFAEERDRLSDLLASQLNDSDMEEQFTEIHHRVHKLLAGCISSDSLHA